MKLLYNIAGTYNSGGMERVLSNKANWLVDNGFDVIIVTTDQRQRVPFFSLSSKIKQYDLNVNYESNNGRSLLQKMMQYPFKLAKHKRGLKRVIEIEKPDITISMFCNDIEFINNINDGSKKVLEVHFCRQKRIQYARKGIWHIVDIVRSKRDLCLVKKFNRFVVLTEEDKVLWGKLDNIMVIPNSLGIIPQTTSSLSNKKVIAVGRFTFQKGFERLIEAWKIVNSTYQDWRLEIIGQGEDRLMLQNKIKHLGLENVVTLQEPRKDIYEIYSDASILAFPSRYEGFGLVIIEAFSFGIPVVAYDCLCGPKDIITDGKDGFLVAEGDVNNMSNRIMYLIKNEDLRKAMGAAAKETSKKYYEETIMKRWVKLFEEL